MPDVWLQSTEPFLTIFSKLIELLQEIKQYRALMPLHNTSKSRTNRMMKLTLL